MKKTCRKTFTPISAISAAAAVCALGASSLYAQTSPVFEYSFPASWNGTGSTITDQSTAGNNGSFDGTLSLDAALPTGGSGNSLNTSAGGILTGGTASLNNTAVANAGGFTMSLDFMWNGTDKTGNGHTQKLIDYSGTESLQLVTTSGGSASLQMQFADDAGAETIAASTTIAANTWYNVLLTFDTTGNSLESGDISGLATLSVDNSIVGSANATKGTYGDDLSRPIGVGQLGANFGYLVGFDGDIYNPSVSLGVAPVPEPSTMALSALGIFGGLGMWLRQRRKS